MSKVYLAERRSDNFAVCLKFWDDVPGRRLREQECRALIRLKHPSIVSLLDFCFEDQPPWLATEYVTGLTLQAYLQTYKPLPAQMVIGILKQILEGLKYAHREGIIHRDLKPANLMLEENINEVRLKILDFGIAVVDEFDHEGRLTAQGADPIGTLLYMAPEQLEGKILTPACDLYAVGLIAWEMLTGASVFEGTTRAQMICRKMAAVDGYILEDIAKSVPEKLRSFITACTVLEPSARPAARDGLALLQSLG